MSRTWKRYSEFLERAPEAVFEWNDPETSARGWLVINTLKGGAAGGGTRMRQGLQREEVEYLSKVMELKFSVSGPPIGGAKSGIDFDPAHPRKREVLARWFEAIRPMERDARVRSELEATGWRIEVIWECETKDANRLKQILFKTIHSLKLLKT